MKGSGAGSKLLKRKAPGSAPAGTAAAASSNFACLAPGWHDLGAGCLIGYWPAALQDACSRLESALAESSNVDWQQRNIVLFGKPIPQPRLVAYMADSPQLAYTYSGATLQPSQWTPEVLSLKAAVEALVQQQLPGTQFNSCLLNLFRSGEDHISWHSDNEALYGRHPTIASVSLGTDRLFQLKRIHPTPQQQQPTAGQQPAAASTTTTTTSMSSRRGHRNATCTPDKPQHSAPAAAAVVPSSVQRLQLPLGGGSVLVMAGATQQHWLHRVPKRKALTGQRISLTFRNIVLPEC